MPCRPLILKSCAKLARLFSAILETLIYSGFIKDNYAVQLLRHRFGPVKVS